MLAATEAALRDGAGGGGTGAAGSSDIAVAAAAAQSDVIGAGRRLAPLDLHGLSGVEARAAVLTTLSQLQVGASELRVSLNLNSRSPHTCAACFIRRSIARSHSVRPAL